jgi:hypothetical protein
MERVFTFFNYYFELALIIFIINTLIATAKGISFVEAIRHEAIRNGLPEADTKKNSVWQNGIYALVAWPVGLWRAIKQFINF